MWKDVPFLYLNHDEVRQHRPPFLEIVEVIETSLKDWSLRRADMPPKIRVSPRDEMYIHALPGYLPSFGVAGIKWQSNVIDNPTRGLPFNIGLVILTNPDDGTPRAVMDCMWITAIRTSAASLTAIKHLKGPEARIATIIGLGVQGCTHLDAMIEARIPAELERIKIYDLSEEAQKRFVAYANAKSSIPIESCRSPELAIRDSDIVITCTTFLKRSDPKVLPDWVKSGSLALPVEVGSYWTPESREAMDRIFTDDRVQTTSFAKDGFFQGKPVHLDAEMGDLLLGRVKGRTSPDERVMCINVGLSLYDIGLGQKIYERAKASKAGTWLKW